MKKNHILIIIMLAALGIVNSCSSDFLEIDPNGSLDQGTLATEEGVNNLLIAAYSMLDGTSNQFTFDAWDGASTNWLWGSIRGLEANKGSNSGDQLEMNQIQTYSEDGSNAKINNKWRMLYEGISRCNNTIVTCGLAVDAGEITEEQATLIVNQARALRGHYHFEAWRMWKDIPYVDETTDPVTVTNTVDISDKILDDLRAGTALPNDMEQVGRFNGTVCRVLLAKALMQMDHNYAEALTLLNTAKTGTKPNGDPIGLADTYGEIFDIANRNGIESVYTVQYSVNDGSGGANAGNGEVLNFPYKGNNASPAGCCGFFIPNQEFVNSFRTSGGLPLPNYEFDLPANAVKNDQGLDPTDPFVEDAGPLDPRLDWSVGRRGIPYWDWGVHTGSDWIRDPSYSGPYSPKKQVYQKSQTGVFTEVGGWTNGWTANGYRMIRYADILLLIAECQIESTTPDLEGARENINLIRARAANTDGWVKEDDGVTYAANYEISTYDTPFADVDAARYALQLERKLELGQEGHRYYDLQRWGNVVTELNRVLTYQKSLSWGTSLYGNATVGAEDVNYPIPQRQIDLSNGALVTNR
jgi:hypothetical protein